MRSSCNYVWTPITDDEIEGEFRSSVTNQLVTYLPWMKEQPNGEETQNHVAIQMKSKRWNDLDKTSKECSSCDLYKTLTFSIIGVCKDTYLGKKSLSYRKSKRYF